jgi:YD repeat-containing protein
MNVVTPASASMSFRYDPAGRLVEAQFPNGTRTVRTYSAQGRVTHLRHEGSAGSALAAWIYDYDAVGAVESITEPADTLQFVYDASHQLTQGGTPGAPEHYTYDPAGNRARSPVGPPGLR